MHATNTKPIRRAAVLGAGTMGSRIAAHLANAGVPVLLLDLVVPGSPSRNTAAQAAIEKALKQKPPAFFTPARTAWITPGNLEDDLGKLADCDWVIEAVTENLEIKRNLLERVASIRGPGTVVTTNTSGIPLAQMVDGFPSEFREHFFGTHFFNPPRYLHLLELIPGPETKPQEMRRIAEFCDRRLGKGVVPCKDSPNFIANRLGCFLGATIQKLTIEGGYTIEEVDTLTGPLIGLPRSASYRLLDIIGLDVWANVMQNLHELVPHDPFRARFVIPDFFSAMLKRGWLGDKSGQGFYKRVESGPDKGIWAIDWKSLEYHPARKASFPSLESVSSMENLPHRLRALLALDDRSGDFLWKLLSDYWVYAAGLIPEIADRSVDLDRAMRWGYAHTLGPFELWDALGVRETVTRMGQEGRPVAAAVTRLLDSGAVSFYRTADAGGCPKSEYFDLTGSGYLGIEPRPGVLVLNDLKRARGVVKESSGASLIDLGDGVLALEFHSKLNTLDDDLIAMIGSGIEEANRNFEALVIANQGENFCAGANLRLVLQAAQRGDWSGLNRVLERFQQAVMAMKYATRPVVAAPFGMTLGGGCELVLHAARVQASAETYIGQTETAVGLIPAGGGCKELLLRFGKAESAFDLIASSRVSASAEEARKFGFLRGADRISMNPKRLVADAKAMALALVPEYSPGQPRRDLKVGGDEDYAALRTGIFMAREGEFISEYDAVIGERLAYVLSGGRLTGTQLVSEQYLLDLEREAFLSLCGHPQTQQRIEHMLKTGKPLRN